MSVGLTVGGTTHALLGLSGEPATGNGIIFTSEAKGRPRGPDGGRDDAKETAQVGSTCNPTSERPEAEATESDSQTRALTISGELCQ